MATLKTLNDLAVGDVVTRYVSAAKIPMCLKVSAIDDNLIHCGPWKFNKSNGAEVDLELGWDGVTATGSIIVPD
ncbi:MAG: hypothetical protein V4621_07780 [Pseudomonadota bacterium]